MNYLKSTNYSACSFKRRLYNVSYLRPTRGDDPKAPIITGAFYTLAGNTTIASNTLTTSIK